MNRRNGMWLTVLCILAAGIFTTSVTSSFVRHRGRHGGRDGNRGPRGTDICAQGSIRTGSFPKGSDGPGRCRRPGKGGKAPQAAGGKEPGNLAPGARAALGSPETAVEEAEQEEAAEAGIQAAAEADAAVEETVKSPLDPAVPAEAVEASGQEAMEAKTVFTKDELDARLEKARELSWQYQGSVKDENAISAYAAAEQLWTLWDQELNLVYGSIRARMTEKEAETLRIAELEWMKERDQAAARAAEASPVPQNQTLESRRAMAEETRVRCYELMEEYEEILERMPDGAASE